MSMSIQEAQDFVNLQRELKVHISATKQAVDSLNDKINQLNGRVSYLQGQLANGGKHGKENSSN